MFNGVAVSNHGETGNRRPDPHVSHYLSCVGSRTAMYIVSRCHPLEMSPYYFLDLRVQETVQNRQKHSLQRHIYSGQATKDCLLYISSKTIS